MDTKTRLRRYLLEGKHSHKNDYGCVMVFLKVDQKEWDNLLNQIEEEDLYQPKDDPSYGKETNPHVTILYGLHGTIKDSEIESDLKDIKEPSIKMKGISEFSNDKFDVLKFDVDSKDLNKLNKRFNEYPNTQTYPDYHPHCTIAYLKPKTAEKYKKKLKDVKINFECENIVYSKVDGTEKTYDFKE